VIYVTFPMLLSLSECPKYRIIYGDQLNLPIILF